MRGRPRSRVTDGKKLCSRCRNLFPVDAFYPCRGLPGSHCRACRAEYIKERRNQDPEKYRAWHREYRKRNRDRLILIDRAWRAKNIDKGRAYAQKSRAKDPARAVFAAAKSRARKYGIPFSISIDDIKIPERCPVLGIEFGPNAGRGPGAHWNSISLDKKDSTLGYIPGNVQVMSLTANRLKGNSSKAHLLAFATWILKEYG